MEEKAKDNLRDSGIYFFNFIARPVGEAFKNGLNLGNPYVSIGYSLLDLINNNSDKVKESKLNRLAKLGGAVYFTGKTIGNLVSIAQSDFENSYNLPFNFSLAYKFGKDAIQFYNHDGNSLLKDLQAKKFGKYVCKKSKDFSKKIKESSKKFWEYLNEFGDIEMKDISFKRKVNEDKRKPVEICNNLKEVDSKEILNREIETGINAIDVGNQLKTSSKRK